jgi:hypothetical protein
MYEINELSFTREKMLSALKTGVSPVEIALQKWTSILNGGEDFGTSSCACCESYYDQNNTKACLAVCPLGDTIGCCSGVYSAWIKHQNAEHMHEYISYAIRCPECEEIARSIYDVISEKARLAGAAFPYAM